MKVLIKKHIKSEADLPKEKNKNGYIIHYEYGKIAYRFGLLNIEDWQDIDWYLVEVEFADLIELPTEEEIGDKADNFYDEVFSDKLVGFIDGYKTAIAEIKNRNRL